METIFVTIGFMGMLMLVMALALAFERFGTTVPYVTLLCGRLLPLASALALALAVGSVFGFGCWL